tara:strand:+ start:295 stop:609 length:315 start_codon:yes stop_codon:yes gene_type:complete
MNKISTFPFRHPLGDCTNNGLTSVGDSFDLYFIDENSTDNTVDNIPDDSLILIKRNLFGKPAWYAKPASLFKSGTHSMMGGNFVYTSDSRFPGDAPIPVHDRVE